MKKRLISLLLLLALISGCFATADEVSNVVDASNAGATEKVEETGGENNVSEKGGASVEGSGAGAGSDSSVADGAKAANSEGAQTGAEGTESVKTGDEGAAQVVDSRETGNKAGNETGNEAGNEAGSGDMSSSEQGGEGSQTNGEEENASTQGDGGEDVDADANEADATKTAQPDENEADATKPAQLDETEVALDEGGLNGTTSPVDNTTSLPDGSYVPEGFSVSGGDGGTQFSCGEVRVSGGCTSAVLVIGSAKYQYVKASGGKYMAEHDANSSTVVIPVALNVENRIIGMTTAEYEAGKEMEYRICVKLADAGQDDIGEDADENLAIAAFALETYAAGSSGEVLEDGEYDIGIESNFAMFAITGRSARLEGEKLIMTIGTSKTTYDRIFIGSKNDAADYPGYVQGAANGSGGYDFTFELPLSALGTSIDFVPGKPDGTWYSKNQYQLVIPETIVRVPGEGESESGDEPTEVENGEYDVPVESSSTMFKVVSCRLTALDGKYMATIALSGTGYDKLFLGTAEAAQTADAGQIIPFAVNADGLYSYSFPVEKLDAEIAVAAHSVKSDAWYDRTLVFKSEGMEKIEEKIEDGSYDASVESSSAMFKVVSCRLTVLDGKYMATIALSGTSYDKLFLGTAEAAQTADADQIIPFAVNADGLYSYSFPVEKLDVEIAVAAHSVKSDAWYDRTLVFKSEGLTRTDDSNQTPDPSGEATPTPAPSATPAPTEAPEADLSGSTSRVDNSTTLPDGVYAPDRFSFSGGSGKVSISCKRVCVSGGRATATIVFSSPNYGYVKANGQKYYGSHGANSSTFEIPVKLNSNNRIIGMTTAMSTDHEVSYTLYIYIAEAEAKAADGEFAEAPVVEGLTCVRMDENDAALLYHIYRYAEGCTAIAVEGVGSYLIAPEDMDLPEEIEDEMTVIRRPVRCAYAGCEEIFARIDWCGGAESVQLAGFEGEASLEYAGGCGAPDYAKLMKAGCDLVIVPEQFADGRVCGTDEAYNCTDLSEDGAAALADAAERFDMLGIPMFVDRAMDEESPEACLEWLKVYGVLLDCEAEAEAAYAAVLG